MVKQDVPGENSGTSKLLGVFGAAPPLCLGEPYLADRPIDPRAKSKQMGAGKWPSPLACPGVFDKQPAYLFAEKEPYMESNKYKDIYEGKPEKKKLGFMSSDFPKRDEFSNTMRTEQLREVLRKEKHAPLEDYEEGEGPPATTAMKKSYLYDVVTRQVPTSFKHHRDDRQGRFFYMNERKQQASKAKEKNSGPKPNTTLTHPAWVNVTVDGRLLTVLVDTAGNVVAQQAATTDLRAPAEDM